MIYFDNAATTYYKPRCVKRAFNKYFCSANPGRSGHKLSTKSAIEIFKTRLTLADFFGAQSEDNVIFTHNCTAALNLAILGSAKNNGHIIVSCFEHNSVLRPVQSLKDKGTIDYTVIYPSNKSYITSVDVQKAIKPNTYLVIVNHISNVTGNKNNITDIAKLCQEKGVMLFVDGAQACGHINTNTSKENIHMYTFAGHKGLYAPQSIGGLILRQDVKLTPIMYGGTGTNSIELTQPNNLPEKFESGTLSTPSIAALRAGVLYVLKNRQKHNKKTAYLTKYLLSKLKANNRFVIYTNPTSTYGVVLFNIIGYDSVEIANILDKYNIYVRAGLHCAPLAHKHLGTTKGGAVRVSLNHHNSIKQINKMLAILQALPQK